MYIDDDDVVRRFLDADRHADYADDDAKVERSQDIDRQVDVTNDSDDDDVVRRCPARC